jgi:hypothetical protein
VSDFFTLLRAPSHISVSSVAVDATQQHPSVLCEIGFLYSQCCAAALSIIDSAAAFYSDQAVARTWHGLCFVLASKTFYKWRTS